MKRILLSCSAICLAAQIQAQPWLNNAWLKGGNALGTNPNTTIGTNATWNAPFQLMSNGQIRMHINQNGVFAGATNASGFIGIGNNFITPLNLLHLDAFAYNTGNIFRTDGNQALINQWQMFTGATAASSTQKFRVFTTLNSPADAGTLQNDQNITLEASSGDMIFNAGGNVERMRILGQNHNLQGVTPWFATANAGNVGIGNPHPLSMLHIGGNGAAGAGWRPWMNIGTFYASNGGFDNMYVGLRQIQPDVNLAVINWGNNPAGGASDRLVFNFTAAAALGVDASGVNGLEMARFATTGNVGGSRFGIGGDGLPLTNPYSTGVDPGNTLEVNSAAITPSATSSGLRFTDLNSTVTPIINPGTGVLGVNAFGDVVYVQGNTNSFGNECGQTQNPLTSDWEIPMGGFNFNFTANAATASSVIIGDQNCNVVPARLGVVNDVHQVAGGFVTNFASAAQNIGIVSNVSNTGAGGSIGVFTRVDGNGFINIGVGADATTVGTAQSHIGLNSNAANALSQSFAVNADVISSSSPFNYGYQTEIFAGTNALATSYGVHSIITNPGRFNYGGYFVANSAERNYGIFAQVPPGLIGGPNWAGFFDGNVVRTGSDNFTSDATLKTNINDLSNAMAIVEQLQPKDFFFDQTVHPHVSLPQGKQYGFIAQDVAPILPELVSEVIYPAIYDTAGVELHAEFSFRSLNYQAFTAILTKAVQEQQQTIEDLQTELADKDAALNDLENRLANIEACLANANICTGSNHQAVAPQNSGQPINEISVELADMERVVLDQNVPNPFAEQTVITYYLPETTGKAQMLFYDNNGRLINSVDLKGTGHGKIQIFAGDLSRGTYTYAIIVDGNIVDSKRMVKMD